MIAVITIIKFYIIIDNGVIMKFGSILFDYLTTKSKSSKGDNISKDKLEYH